VLYTAAGLRRESAAFWATIYGLAWWIVGWFAVMPPPLRFAPWAAAKDPALLLACLAFGAVFSLAVFLQPMADATGWSRAGISAAMTLVFLAMGVGGFVWGMLSDRYGAREAQREGNCARARRPARCLATSLVTVAPPARWTRASVHPVFLEPHHKPRDDGDRAGAANERQAY
jgi:hypothetical protein